MEDQEHTKTPIIGVIINALNIIAGVSFVGLPYALKQSGLVIGLVVLVVICYLCDITHQLLVECSKFHPILRYKHIDSYEDLVSIPFGKVGEYVLMFSVFVVSFGSNVGYVIMIKDMVPVLLGMEKDSMLVVSIVWAFFAVPLTMLKNLSSLAFVSGLSLLLSLYLAIVMIYDCPIGTSIESHGGLAAVTQEYWFRPNVFATISMFTDALAWQHGAFTVFNSLQEATLRRWRLVTGSVNTMACILYAAVAIPGYLSYLDSTDGDIFLNFPDSSLFNVARMFFSFIVIMTYPIEMLIARDVTLSFIRRNEIVESTSDCSVKKDESQKSSGWGKYLVSGKELVTVMVLNLIALGLGIWLRDLGVVLAFVGAVGASTACFIMPGLIYIGVNGGEFLKFTSSILPSCATDTVKRTNTSCNRSYPFWYYIFGFPIWCHLASIGEKNMSTAGFVCFEGLPVAGNNQSTLELDDSKLYTDPVTEYAFHEDITMFSFASFSENVSSEQVVQPNCGRFLTAMMFVVLGLANMIITLVVKTE